MCPLPQEGSHIRLLPATGTRRQGNEGAANGLQQPDPGIPQEGPSLRRVLGQPLRVAMVLANAFLQHRAEVLPEDRVLLAIGGVLADRWSRITHRGRAFTSALGILLLVPALFVVKSGCPRTPSAAAPVFFVDALSKRSTRLLP